MLSPRFAAIALLSLTAASQAAGEFQITPAAVTLEGNFARLQLIVTACDAKGTVSERSADLTHQAVYQSSNLGIVTVSPAGQIIAIANGQATVSATVSGVTRTVSVTASGIAASA